MPFLLRLFHCLLAIDVLQRLPNAAKYGVANFNVAHFRALDALIDPFVAYLPHFYALCLAATAAASLTLALSERSAAMEATAAVAHALAVACSQIDSFQHHYLLCLVLGLFALRAPRWALRLQLALLYFWTVAAKLDAAWLSGATLTRILGGRIGRWLARAALSARLLAQLVIAAELCLLIILYYLQYTRRRASRRLCVAALLVAVPVHASFSNAMGGFEIEYFSAYMVLLWCMALPLSFLNVAPPALPTTSLRAGAVDAALAATLLAVYPPFFCPLLSPLFAGTLIVLLVLAARRHALPVLVLLSLVTRWQRPDVAFLTERAGDFVARSLPAEALAAYNDAIALDVRAAGADALVAATTLAVNMHAPMPPLRAALQRVPSSDHWKLYFAMIASVPTAACSSGDIDAFEAAATTGEASLMAARGGWLSDARSVDRSLAFLKHARQVVEKVKEHC